MARFAHFIALLAFAAVGTASPTGTLIVGGVEADKGEFPFMVDLRRGGHSCGANLINAEWVVTAAHCTQGTPSAYELVAGDHDISSDEGTEQRRTVERIVNHPSYSAGTFQNDISLMKVSQPFELNSRIQPVALPLIGFPATEMTTTAGWGRTSEGGPASNVLLKVDVPHINNTFCNEAYSGRIHSSMICAGVYGEGGKDACQGDSGGPLMCRDQTGTNYLCGIVSWGSGCARPLFPGVYARVSEFTGWVNSVIGSS